MTHAATAPPSEGRRYQRLTGSYSQGRPGPLLLALAGVHGNEPAGVAAQQRVLARLERERLGLRGTLVCAAGNLGALAQNQRYLRRDLNRQWTTARIDALRRREPAADDDEDREQRELLRLFDDCVAAAARGPLLFVDLHTSSADGSPFTCFSDTLPNRRLALALPVPAILGLEETIDGAMMDYFSERGLAALTIEGGRHCRPETVDNLEAALWLVLLASGALRAAALPDADRCRAVLQRAAAGMPAVVELRRHHRIAPEQGFAMRPGFASFQPVRCGQVLADDRNGVICAAENGRILLPLYQRLGEDGFFLCRDVRPFWLRLAACLCRLRLHALLPLLPGVRRHPERGDALLVDPRVARFLVREVCHLLGYRRCRPERDRLLFTRRPVAAATRRLPWRA